MSSNERLKKDFDDIREELQKEIDALVSFAPRWSQDGFKDRVGELLDSLVFAARLTADL